jgi:hypothetical protein
MNSIMTRDPAGTVIVDRSNAKFFAVTFTRSPWSMVGAAKGPPGAVVGVASSPEGLEPGVLWVGKDPVVTMVVGIRIVVPVGRIIVVGIVVGMGVTPLPVCVVHPAHRIAAPTMQIRRME